MVIKQYSLWCCLSVDNLITIESNLLITCDVLNLSMLIRSLASTGLDNGTDGSAEKSILMVTFLLRPVA